MLTAEDIYYLHKIEALANERLRFFRNKEYSRQQQETNNSNKRPRSTTVEDHHDHKKRNVAVVVRTPPPPVLTVSTERLKEFIVNEMKGTNVKLVIQKTLYKSDTEKGLNRLNMPVNQLENNEFLTADEKQTLNKRNTKDNDIEVLLLGPTLEVYGEPMKLKMWHMASTVNYVLTTAWFKFWKENEVHLPKNSKIKVWSFRRDQQLCFAVVAA
ncbi:hypothetical protein L1987_55091 [Smallanthus sonchifolius]|uniref:Uncharacterized protein n=1 Tax=Smallanthus sonchifolius TaxID=185202 RepID=A0ACB9E8V5_9ASTR|nr:hypothetical protein L1987_55091 [Smallanthus sonchifolius]